jgi:hypothetical protein
MCSQAGEVVVVRRVRRLVVVLLRVASRLNARATHDCLRAVRGGLGVHELLHKHLECGTGVARGAARAHAVRHVQSGDSYHVGADANHPEELARAGQIGRVPRALRKAGWAMGTVVVTSGMTQCMLWQIKTRAASRSCSVPSGSYARCAGSSPSNAFL